MSTSTSPMRRQPAGQPIGGQFAGRQLAPSGLDLTDVDDPWGDSPGNDLAALCEEVGYALRAQPYMGHQNPGEDRAQALESFREWNQDRQALNGRYGSLDQAVVAAGRQVAERGCELAGIHPERIAASHSTRLVEAQENYDRAAAVDEAARQRAVDQYGADLDTLLTGKLEATGEQETQRFRDAIDRVRDQMRAIYKPAVHQREEAYEHLQAVRSGVDDQTKADLAQLTDGYLAALAEVRPMGGDLQVSEDSKKPAKVAFAEAASVFPTDWLEASNDRIGAVRNNSFWGEETDQAPVAKISRGRAHYSDWAVQETRRREPVKSMADERDVARYVDADGRSTKPAIEVAASELGDGLFDLWRYEVAHGHSDPDTPPPGREWEWWTSPDGERTAWRRPQHQMRVVERAAAPEMTTSVSVPRVAGRSQTFATSAHELSHRMEYSVPGIKELEAQFLTRRATNPATGKLEDRVLLYPRSQEYALADSFNVAYTGKIYPDGAHEVLSTGMDQVFGGRNGAGIGLGNYTADPEHRDFVLGLLATAGRKTSTGGR